MSPAPGVAGASDLLPIGKPFFAVPKDETKGQGEQGYNISVKVRSLLE